MDQNQLHEPAAEGQRYTLSARDLKILSERFGHSAPYPGSVSSIADDTQRQLAEHDIP